MELKPCPFCGWKKARVLSRYVCTRYRYIEDYRLYSEERRAYIRCNRCHAHGGSVTGFITKGFKPIMTMPTWEEREIFADSQPQTCPPPLPEWATTKEALEEKAAEKWNRRYEQ